MDVNPLALLLRIQREVPIVRYATGLAGVAAAISIITYFVGDTRASARLFGVTLVGMMIMIILTAMPSSLKRVQTPAIALVWVVVGDIAFLIIMTASALVFERPCAWMRFLGVADGSGCETKTTRLPDTTFSDPLAVRPRNRSPGM
jgi:hypothetical protein